jgi:hypothetical protein
VHRNTTNEQQQIDDNPIVNLEEENDDDDVIIENENHNIDNNVNIDDIADINANVDDMISTVFDLRIVLTSQRVLLCPRHITKYWYKRWHASSHLQ